VNQEDAQGWHVDAGAVRNAGLSRRRLVRLGRAATAGAVLSLLVPNFTPAHAATSTIVSLTFDNDTNSQYTLAYQQALQPAGVHATFYVNSGTVGGTTRLSWAQLGTLVSAGDDIGGKTVDGTNLTNLSAQQQVTEICNDRQNIVQHGITPTSFAYPGGAGANNSTIQGEVENCGYGNARSAGSLSPGGSTFAETLPPKNWLSLRAYAPNGQVTLASLQTLVTNAAAKGGWVPVVMQKVCSQTQDPNNYSACTSSAGWVDLADLQAFITWVQNAGQSGGAPAGTSFQTMGATAVAADKLTPTTTMACNGAPCSSSTYNGTVYVSLSAVDLGSGVATTRYTTDGTVPTLASPAYGAPFPLTADTTVQFRSWDAAGNVEPASTQPVSVQEPPDSTPPVTTIACNGSPCASTPYTAPVTVTLSATDNPGGWGVANTYYTTDGSTPTTSSSVYTGPFVVKQPTTVNFFSTDLAGNAEQPRTQLVRTVLIITLTFDDGIESGYNVAFLHALQPHGLHATFFINTASTDTDPGSMTWTELTTLYNHSNDIGGHTLDEANLTSTAYTQQQLVAEVCNDRQNLVSHGLDPVSFAYPFGAYNANAEQIVQSCGYSSGRAAGGIDVSGPGAGPAYSETIPPKNALAIRTVYSSTAPAEITLSQLETPVTAAAQNSDGWLLFTFHGVCSQTYDPAFYSGCKDTSAGNSWAPVELDTLNAFLDWVQNAGQPGGAPAGTTVETVRQVINGPDLTPPTTTITCDGGPCAATTYGGSTTVALNATDPGGAGLQGTYYTTDGSTPTTSSPTYVKPFTITQSMEVQFFSVDNAGNVEPLHSQQLLVAPNPDPVIGAAGDIACDPAAPAFGNGFGVGNDCRAMSTVSLLTGIDAVLPIGDDQYDCGGYSAFMQSYDTSWGQKLAITHPVPGDKDYETSGGTDCPTVPGAGYYRYFGAAAGDPTKGYYSYDLGQWHIIALNTSPCALGNASFCAAGSAQDQWLQNDLATHASSGCTLAYYQNPRFTSTPGGGDDTYQQLWRDLYYGGTDVVLNGDSHWYERFAPMDAFGGIDTAHGLREFIVGTGGAPLDTPATELPTSQVLNNTTHGIIKLTLHAGGYDWSFLNDGESSFTDAGSGTCHASPDSTPPTTTATCNGGGCSNGWYAAPVSVALSATDDSSVADTYYTTDGSTPTTSSTVYSGPFTVPVTSTVKFFSVDVAGNAEQVQSQQIDIDTSTPTTTALCNGVGCSAGWYNAPVQMSLSAVDGGGSGIAATYYTTNGSTPTTSSPKYNGPFTLSKTTTVQFFSVNNAGTAEAVETQLVQVDTAAPTTTIACNGAACSSGWYTASPVTVTLSANDNSGGSGVAATYYTTDGSDPTTSPTAVQYSGPFTVASTTTVRFFSLDVAGNAETVRSQAVQIDTGAPTTTALCNGVACSAGWYTSPVTVALSATDSGGSGVAATYYTTDGSTPTTSSPKYSGPFTVSRTTTVQFFSVNNAGTAEAIETQVVQVDAVAPTTTITCNGAACASGWYTASPVTVALSATDNSGGSGVAATYYTTDGSDPSTSPTAVQYAGPFTVAATASVRFFSVDVARNAETPRSQAVQIDTSAPVTTALCNSAACAPGWYTTSPVTVTLSAADSGGSGIAATYYTTDGTTPTMSSPKYTGAFKVTATTTVEFFSVDNAGNAEAVETQVIEVDAIAPTTTIACNGAPCTSTAYKQTAVTITLTATDQSGGSGVAATYYTTDGSTPTASSTVYTGPFTLAGTATVKFFSVDVAGNAEAVRSQTVQVDAIAPTTTALCNSTACSSGWYKTSPVVVSLSAVDNPGGTGVAATYYTTNGSTPTTSSTKYAKPFNVSATSTVKFFSVDKAGNVESVRSQLIQIDTAAPTAAISCNGAGCSGGWYKSVSITITATDNAGGSGVAAIYYTTDGSNPQTSSTAVHYTAPFNLAQTSTVKFYAVDVAGNSGSVKSQGPIQVDGVAPTVSITAPASGSSFKQGTHVTVTASASDLGSGSGAPSGIANVTFYLDGTINLHTVGGSPYSFSWDTSNVAKGTHYLTAVATDKAGNATTSVVITVTIT
jgi:peptidoglycan/xylan/chitin deacetylase (PgdA/CDA1 family)